MRVGDVGHRLGEVVLDARLVDDEVRELADAVRIVGGHAGADDARGVLGVRPPEGHLGDPVGLLDDAVREAERLERLDAACLHAVGLTELQTSLGALDQACRDARELGELRRRDVAGRAAADDQDVDLVRELGRPLAADARRGLHAGITRDVSMVVELHGAFSPVGQVRPSMTALASREVRMCVGSAQVRAPVEDAPGREHGRPNVIRFEGTAMAATDDHSRPQAAPTEAAIVPLTARDAA